MSVAVIVVNYNAGQWLQKSVISALKATQVSQVYVVDNASTDNSIAELKEFLGTQPTFTEKIHWILNVENLGFGRANNQALEKIADSPSGNLEFVLLLNPDCELSEDVLPTMLPYFGQYPQLGMASCVIHNADGSIQSTCRRKFPTPWTAFLRMSQLQRLGFAKRYNFDLGAQPLPKEFDVVEAISGAFMLVRLKAIKEVGVFDEAYFMHCEDLDWCKRFSQSNWLVGFVPEVSVLHEKGVSSQSRPVGVLWNLHQGMLRFFDKFYRHQYPLFFRMIVKVGIYVSFFARAMLSILKSVFGKAS